MASWVIQHKDHDHNVIHSIEPENLHFAQNNSAPHEISYEISLDNPVVLEENTVEGDAIGEYQHDWQLWRNGVAMDEMAGIITSVHSNQGTNMLEVAGKSWLHYLDRRFYPFDPLDPYAYRLSAYQVDVTSIIHDMISAVQAQPNSLQYDLSDLVSRTTYVDNMRIEFGDTEMILSKISTMAEGKPGFDFACSSTRQFQLFYPEFRDPTDPNQLAGYLFVQNDPEIPATEAIPGVADGALYEADWSSGGPAGTHILGLGAGLASKLGSAWGSQDAQQIFRRLDMSIDFGDVPNRAKLDRLTKGALRAGIGPIRDAPVKVLPEKVVDFWNRYRPGVYYVELASLEGAHGIRGRKKLQQIDCTVSNEGEELVELHSTLYDYWFNTDLSTIVREP